jgi:uncharacterized protein YndB with AHSA1/START domain
MEYPATSPTITLSLHRVVRASPARVFRAWTEADELRRWFAAAEGYTTPVAEVDLRVGGRYRMGMRAPNGELSVATGVYEEIVPPARLVLTWRWEHEGPALPTTRLTLEFRPHPDGTELVLVQVGFIDVAAREKHSDGWQGCLDSLERLLRKTNNQ